MEKSILNKLYKGIILLLNMKKISSWKKFETLFIIFLIGSIIEGLLAGFFLYTKNYAEQGLWPIIVIISMSFYLIYSVIFILIDTIDNSSKKYIILFNTILAIIGVISTILYYTLSLDDFWRVLVMGIFLVMHLVIVLVRKKS